MSSWQVGFTGPDITASINLPQEIGDISVSFPPNTYTAGVQDSETNDKIEYFFNVERGSISRSSAYCSVFEVEIDINNPSLSLTTSFVNAIQEIDNAILDVLDNWPNLLDKLKIFIEQFGTHYAQKSTMAIGANFETRYTAKETLENTEQIRNKCSSEAGGISIFGYGYQESSATCQGSLSNITNGIDTAVRRYKATTFGTMPGNLTSLSEWSAVAQEMYNNKQISPHPTQQVLRLIIDILRTPTVANIKNIMYVTKNPMEENKKKKSKAEGAKMPKFMEQAIELAPNNNKDKDPTLIDIEKVLYWTTFGYLYYPYFFPEDVSYGFACAQTVKIGKNLYHMQPITTNGRVFYKDEYSSNSSRYLFYGWPEKLFYQRWSISSNFEDISSIILTTAPCPLRNAKFEGSDIIYPKFLNVFEWYVCAKKCSTVNACKYWQHDGWSYNCILFKDFDGIKQVGDTTISDQ